MKQIQWEENDIHSRAVREWYSCCCRQDTQWIPEKDGFIRRLILSYLKVGKFDGRKEDETPSCPDRSSKSAKKENSL